MSDQPQVEGDSLRVACPLLVGKIIQKQLFRHMQCEAADLIVKGTEGAIGPKTLTYDFERLMEGTKLLK